MKKLALLACVILVAGCAGIGGPGGPLGAASVTGGAGIMTNVTYPAVAPLNKVAYKELDFEIVGPVQVEVQSSSILGLFQSGNSGYIELYKQAVTKGAHDVINVKIDTHYYNILGIISRVKTIMHGTAIKWTNVK